MNSKPIIATEKSANKKTGVVSTTYAPISSCPTTCPFLNAGCYAQHGPSALHLGRINQASEGMTQIEIAQAEAAAIRALSGKQPLRLHVVGDCSSNEAARIVSEACEEYAAAHGRPVWTYTHAWRTVDAQSWGKVSVLASCETAADVIEAFDRGYAPSVTGEDLEIDSFSFKTVVCPAQTKDGVKCTNCRLCWSSESLRAGRKVIVFLPHGAKQKTVGETVRGLRNK